jgi:hypothetical protein
MDCYIYMKFCLEIGRVAGSEDSCIAITVYPIKSIVMLVLQQSVRLLCCNYGHIDFGVGGRGVFQFLQALYVSKRI